MQAGVSVESVIERVEVFRSQALVTRRAQVLTTGLSGGFEVSLVGLPLGLLDDSVRLSLGEAEGVRVVDLHLGWNLGQRDAKLRTEAHEKLRALARERSELEVARDREAARIQLLEALLPVNIPASDLPDPLAFGSRHQLGPCLDLAKYVREQLSATRVRRRELERRRRDLLDRMALARDELERESQEDLEALAVLRKIARLQLELERPLDELELRLSYLIPGARWVPEYELRVMTEADEAELVLKALVAQRTGEAWDKSGLAFSTADLRRSTELPELDSWRIGKVQPARATGWRPLPEGLDELFESYDRGVRSLPPAGKTRTPNLPDMPRLGKAEQVEITRRPSMEKLRDKLEKQVDRSDFEAGAVATPEPEPSPVANHMADYPEEVEEDYDECESEIEEICTSNDMELRMEMPPPAPASAPMRSAPRPRAKEMKKKSRRRDVERSMVASQAVSGGAVDGFALSEASMDGNAEIQMEAGLAASRDALGYQDLRMQGPDGGSMRGQLKAVGLRERLTEGLAGAPDEIVETVQGLPAEVWSRVIGSQAPRLTGLALPRHAVALDQSAGHFAVRYPMESLGSVPPDGQLHALTLLRRQGRVRRVFRCVPLLDDNVYQMVEFNNPLQLPLLAGPVRVYRGGDYVVTSPLWTTPPGKTLTVNLGVEPDIVTARNVKFHESTEGLFGGDTALIHQIEIEVRSRMAQPARVEVFERVPTTHDDDIKVEIVKSSPKAQEYDQTDRGRPVRGGLRFGFELQAGKTVTCSLEYRVTIPSKQVLVGGNRRD